MYLYSTWNAEKEIRLGIIYVLVSHYKWDRMTNSIWFLSYIWYSRLVVIVIIVIRREGLGFVCVCVCVCVLLSRSVVSISLQPLGLQPTRLLCPWNFPGKNTWVGCHFFLQGIFPTQGSNPRLLCLLHWRVDSLPTELSGKQFTGCDQRTLTLRDKIEWGQPLFCFVVIIIII